MQAARYSISNKAAVSSVTLASPLSREPSPPGSATREQRHGGPRSCVELGRKPCNPTSIRLVASEPLERAAQHVLAVSWLANPMSLTGVDDHLRRHTAGGQCLMERPAHRQWA